MMGTGTAAVVDGSGAQLRDAAEGGEAVLGEARLFWARRCRSRPLPSWGRRCLTIMETISVGRRATIVAGAAS